MKSKRFWKLRCDQMLKHKEEMTARDTELVLLKARVLALEGNRRNSASSSTSTVSSGASTSIMDDVRPVERGPRSQIRRGRPLL